ncbi:MAG TPA: hypothetical protein PLH57_01565 [Oligoflexia bacterium]|nr:hypothetical protein [Oligoflexia bacterium]
MFLKFNSTSSSVLSLGVLAALVSILSGCGRELKIRVAPSEEVRHSAASDLVRQVEIRYRNAAGEERFRESVSVTGLGQPLDIKNESIQDLDWSKDGRWEANAFNGDGALMLHASTQADPEEDEQIDLVLARASGPQAPANLNSVFLKSFRTTGFSVDTKHSVEKLRSPVCYELPAIYLDAGSGALARGVFFETSVAGTAVRVAMSKDGERRVLPVHSSGDSYLDLADEIEKIGSTRRRNLYIFTDEYEGCVTLSAGLSNLLDPTLTYKFLYEAGRNVGMGKGMAGEIVVLNPNPIEVAVAVNCSIYSNAQDPNGIFIGPLGRDHYVYKEECQRTNANHSFTRSGVIAKRDTFRVPVCGYGNLYGESQGHSGLVHTGFTLQCSARLEVDGLIGSSPTVFLTAPK